MATIISLQDRKRNKLATAVVGDLARLINKMDADRPFYEAYKKYIPVNGLLAELTITRNVLKLHFDKYSKLMEETQGNKQ